MNVLRYYREQAGLSQQELSKRSGVPQQTISMIESELRTPRVDNAIALSTALGKTVEEVFKKKDDQQSS